MGEYWLRVLGNVQRLSITDFMHDPIIKSLRLSPSVVKLQISQLSWCSSGMMMCNFIMPLKNRQFNVFK